MQKKILVSHRELEGISERYSFKVFEIGNIIREDILNFKILDQDDNNLNNIKILILGGSQGAKVFAEELPQIFEKLKESQFNLKIYQQCQKNQIDQLSKFYRKANIEFELFSFTNKITDYYSKANIVITRAGASVLGELINIKIPFILIPLPTSADDHQLKNAEFYVKKGCGYLLRENDIKNNLFDLIKSIFEDKLVIKKILLNQKQYSDKDIFTNLNTQINEILNEKN